MPDCPQKKEIMKTLRDYQKNAVDATVFRCAENPALRGILVLPTGAGKSLVCAYLCRHFNIAGQRILILTHNDEIIKQNRAELVESGLSPSVFCAQLKEKRISELTVASIQSFVRLKEYPHFDVIIVDEAHRIAPSELGQYGAVISAYPDASVIGLTATAYRLGSGLIVDSSDNNKLFDELIYEVPASLLIERGHLVQPRYLCDIEISESDLDSVKLKKGEFDEKELEQFYRERLEDTCKHILAHRCGKTMVFCVSIQHVEDVYTQMLSLGVAPDAIARVHSRSETEKDIAIQRMRDADSGLELLISCEQLTTGVNIPCLETVAIVRATKSIGLWVQMAGRGLRTHPGKESCLILDYGCNVSRHDKIENITTQVAEKMHRNRKNREKAKEWSPYRICKRCGAPFERKLSKCPSCGSDTAVRAKVEYSQAQKLSTSGRWIEAIENIHVSRHHKKGSPDSLKIIATLKQKNRFEPIRRVTNYYAFDHSNAWVKGASRNEFRKLIATDIEVPNEDAVSWALAQFESDGVLIDVTHVELVMEKGFEKIRALISVDAD